MKVMVSEYDIADIRVGHEAAITGRILYRRDKVRRDPDLSHGRAQKRSHGRVVPVVIRLLEATPGSFRDHGQSQYFAGTGRECADRAV